MTCDDLFRNQIAAYTEKWTKHLAQYRLPDSPKTDVVELAEELDILVEKLESLRSAKPEQFSLDLAEELDRKYGSAILAYNQAVEGIHKKAEQRRRERDAARVAAIAEADKAVEASVSGLTAKYDKLITYRDKLTDATLRYGIEPSDISIDTDNMSRAEMETLVDAALRACATLGEDKIREKLSVIYTPADTNQDQRVVHAVTVIGCMILLAPIALVALFSYMAIKISSVYQNISDLQIADKLMYGIDFAKFRDEPQYESIPEVDYTDIDEWESVEIAKMETGNPTKVRDSMQNSINENHSRIADAYMNASNSIMRQYDALIRSYEKEIGDRRKVLDDYLAKAKSFGSACSDSYTLDTRFTLGRKRDLIDVQYDFGLRNIVFGNRSPEMLIFMKLLLSNALLAVRPKQFYCTIFDPEGLGADFATFLAKEVEDYVSIETKDFNKVLDTHRAHAQTSVRILDQMDINTYNKDAESKGMVTLEYKLLIIVSGVDKPTENRILTEFMQMSARTGVFVWLVASTQVKECLYYATPFADVESPYPATPELFAKVVSTYVDTVATLKSAAILYKPVFEDKYLPKENWWKENTDRGIEINIGLQDGDPSKGYTLTLGDGNPHCLCVGGSGAGKSGLINQMLLALCCRYSPSTLELVMVDFKRAEFASLTYSDTHISRIPHAKIIAGTSDGEYAISIFEYLMAEMHRRTKLFAAAEVKKLETYNKKMRETGQVEKCLPRVLFLVDEFQQMFMAVEPKALERITAYITSLSKLARFCGCHMFFCSQSMTNSVPKDTLDQFTMRIVLRCSSDVSGAMLGSPAAAKIKAPQGYGYSNLAGGETQDSTRLWRIPFASEDVIYSTLEQVQQLCEERREVNHRAYFYDEEETHDDSLLKSRYDWIASEKRMIVLGERTSFSLNKAPVNFRLTRSDGENIFFYAFEPADFNNVCMTLIETIQANPEARLLINCADADLFRVLDIESWYSKDFMDIARPTVDPTDWLDALMDLIETRERENPDSYGPLYFMAIRWDKQMGIYRDENYKLTEEWKTILLKAPTVDIHIIICAQTFKDIKGNVTTLCNHIIGAKGPEEASYKFFDNAKISKFPNSLGFGLYKYGSTEHKFKIYQHTFTLKAEEREAVL